MATGNDVEALASSVAGINVGENTPVVATAGSTIPPPTAFTTASEHQSASGTATTTATLPAAPAAPNIPPHTSFTPSSLPPPSEIPASFTAPTTHITTETPTQVSPQPLVQTAEVPMHPLPPDVSPLNPGLPPPPLSQPSPLTMGGAPTVPSMPSLPQSLGNPDHSVPMIPLSGTAGMQPSPAVSQYYSSPVVPPPAFTGESF